MGTLQLSQVTGVQRQNVQSDATLFSFFFYSSFMFFFLFSLRTLPTSYQDILRLLVLKGEPLLLYACLTLPSRQNAHGRHRTPMDENANSSKVACTIYALHVLPSLLLPSSLSLSRVSSRRSHKSYFLFSFPLAPLYIRLLARDCLRNERTLFESNIKRTGVGLMRTIIRCTMTG